MQVPTVQWKSAEIKEASQNAPQELLASPVHSRTPLWQAAQRGVDLLLSEAGRPVRLVCTGGVAALCQLSLLSALSHQGWNPALANITASLLGTEVNFALSFLFTWRDRCSSRGVKQVLRRWIAYHTSIVGTLLLSQLLFLAARLALPLLLASLLGTCITAAANFVLMNHFVFRWQPRR